jgi:hypothetical protein
MKILKWTVHQVGYNNFLMKEDRAKKGWCILWQSFFELSFVFCGIIINHQIGIFQLLGFEVFQVRLKKKAASTVSIEIHKGAIFDRLKIK